METKNSIETKKETETKSKTVDNEKTDLSKIIKELVTISSILSLILTVLSKFISMGTVWYYQFEFNYYDFSITKTDLFLFIYTILSALSGILIAIFVSYTIKRLQEKFKIKSFLIEILLDSFIAIIVFSIIFIILKYLLIYRIAYSYYLIVATFSYILTNIFLPNYKSVKNYLKVLCVISCILIVFYTLVMFGWSYSSAQSNKDFQIINYTDPIDKQHNYYVVISESKNNFSAYECEINEDTLVVYTNYHKYFDISTDYEVYSFKNIDYIEKHIKYIDGKYETVTNTYDME